MNRPGGGGNIGAAAAAKSALDGYTLHLGAQSLAVNATLQPSMDFDPIADFDPIILVGTAQDVLLVPLTSPFRSVSDLIQYARQHPCELNYGSLGTGTSAHLATVLFSDLAGIRLRRLLHGPCRPPRTSYPAASPCSCRRSVATSET